MKYLTGFLPFLLVFGFGTLSAQSFEGVMTINAKSGSRGKSYTVTVKDHQSKFESQEDNDLRVTIITDWAAETTTMLKTKGDMKYGFRINTIPRGTYMFENDPNYRKEYTIESTTIDSMHAKSYTRLTLRNNTAVTEATVMNDIGFPLSKYFPAFVSGELDPEILKLREAVDEMGFVSGYWEKNIITGEEKVINVDLEPKDIPIDAFNPEKDFIIHTQNSLQTLFSESQQDEGKQNELASFRLLFGKH